MCYAVRPQTYWLFHLVPSGAIYASTVAPQMTALVVVTKGSRNAVVQDMKSLYSLLHEPKRLERLPLTFDQLHPLPVAVHTCGDQRPAAHHATPHVYADNCAVPRIIEPHRVMSHTCVDNCTSTRRQNCCGRP